MLHATYSLREGGKGSDDHFGLGVGVGMLSPGAAAAADERRHALDVWSSRALTAADADAASEGPPVRSDCAMGLSMMKTVSMLCLRLDPGAAFPQGCVEHDVRMGNRA